MKKSAGLFLLIMFPAFFIFISCDDDDDDSVLTDDDDDTSDDDDDDDDGTAGDDDPGPSCDSDFRPMVFCHGYIENGDAFSTQAMRFGSNNYCLDRIYIFDWNTVFSMANIDLQVALLEEYIDEVLFETGADQIDLMGHSMGGWLAYEYCSRPENAAKVVHVGILASWWDDVPNNLPVINISSKSDFMTGEQETPGATNIVFDDLDHLQVATDSQTFEALYTFFNDGIKPDTLEVVPEEDIFISGRAAVIATNTPSANMTIEIYEVNNLTAQRISSTAKAVLKTDAKGYWGPFKAEAGAYYEFVCVDHKEAQMPVHYYREPFIRSNNKVYLRTFPDPDNFLGTLVGHLPLSNEYSIFAWLNINQAVVYGRDTFFVNGIDIATPQMSDAQITTIAIFFMDINFNGISDETAGQGLFAVMPFLRFFDMRIPSDPDGSIVMEFNGRTLAAQNWRTKSEGVSIIVFD